MFDSTMFYLRILILPLTAVLSRSKFIPKYNCEAGLEDFDMMRSLGRDVCETKHMNIANKNNCYTQFFGKESIPENVETHLHIICFQRDKIEGWLRCFERTTCEVNGPCTDEYSKCLDAKEKLLKQMRDAPPDGFAPGQGNPYTNKPKGKPEERMKPEERIKAEEGIKPEERMKPEERIAPDWKSSSSSNVATSTGTVWSLSIFPVLSNVYLLVLFFSQLK